MKRYNLGVGEISWRGSVFLVLINYLIAYTKYYSLSKQKIKILNSKNYSRFDLNFFLFSLLWFLCLLLHLLLTLLPALITCKIRYVFRCIIGEILANMSTKSSLYLIIISCNHFSGMISSTLGQRHWGNHFSVSVVKNWFFVISFVIEA